MRPERNALNRAISMVCVLALVAPAAADPRKVVVMQSEGRADAALRAKIDAAILKLVHASDPQAAAGDITFSEAAAGVGCSPDEKGCKDEVIGMLAVDELVYATATPKPGGVEIAVHRVSKGTPSRDAQMLLASGDAPDHLDGLASLFKPAGAAPPEPTPSPTPVATPTSTPGPGPTEPTTPDPTAVAPTPELAATATPAPGAPSDQGDIDPHRRRLELAGMIGGGSFVVIGFLLWGQASSLDSEIQAAPSRTLADVQHIQDLESRADGYANWGNLLFLTGVIAGGIGGYMYWKDRKAHRARTASITPGLFDRGGVGLVLTVGGTP